MTAPIRFPGESDEYRVAREQLLHSEIELRSRLEAVARQRQALPLGGPLKEDYAFEERTGEGASRTVRLSELFEPGKDSLAVYGYMFSAEMDSPCTYCTSFLDGLNGSAPHIVERTNLVIVAKSPIERLQ